MNLEIKIADRHRKDAETYASMVWDYFYSPHSDVLPVHREIKTIRAFAEMTPYGVVVSHPSLVAQDREPLMAFIHNRTSGGQS